MAGLHIQRKCRRGAELPVLFTWLVVFSALAAVVVSLEEESASEHELPKENIATRANYTGPGHWAVPPAHIAPKVGFVPLKIYSQVRHTDTVRHLPRREALRTAVTAEEIANAPRLREVVSTKKLGEVYSEEGYEDSAYDHADFEKQEENEEGYEHSEEVTGPRRTRHRGGDSEHQGSDVDLRYVEVEAAPGKPRTRLSIVRKAEHMVTVENGVKRVYPSEPHISPSHTIHRTVAASPDSSTSPVRVGRTPSNGRPDSYFFEPLGMATSVSAPHVNMSDKQEESEMMNRRLEQAALDVDVPATVLTPPKLPSSAVQGSSAFPSLVARPRPVLNRDADDDVVILQRELTRGTANNYEKILLPRFFTNNVYDLYLGIKRNHEHIPVSATISNESEARELVSSTPQSKPDAPTVANDTDSHEFEKYVTGLTMLHFGGNKTSSTPESKELTRLVKVESVENSATTTVPAPPESRNASEIAPRTPNSTGKIVRVKGRRRPANTRIALRTVPVSRPEGNSSSENIAYLSKRKSTVNRHFADASSRRTKNALPPSPFYEDLDVGMSEKKFLHAFANFFRDPIASIKTISTEGETINSPANTVALKNGNVPVVRFGRGVGERALDRQMLVHDASGRKNKTVEKRSSSSKDKEEDRQESVVPEVDKGVEYDSNKYPFYSSLPPGAISSNSPLRYALAWRLVPRKSPGGMEFYESREEVRCPEVSPKLRVVPDRKSPGEWNKSPRPKMPRLSGLGDKIDCLRTKYFGVEPLDNPLFSEPLVSHPTSNTDNMDSVTQFIQNIKSLQLTKQT